MKCLVQTVVQCYIYCISLTLIIVVIKADNYQIPTNNEKVNSDNTDTDISIQNNWRAINRQPEELIVPYDTDSKEITVTQGERYDRLPRRRRIVRKGKRRLNPYTGPSKFTDDDQQYEKNFRIVRSQRPSQYLRDQEDYAEEHWQGEAFAEEQLAYQRPYQKRRRKIPVFVENIQDESDTIDSSIEEHVDQKPTSAPEDYNSAKSHFSQYRVTNDATTDQNDQQETKSSKTKSYRKPYSAHRNQKTNDESNETVPNLKTLLKQREGSLSLVELLQEKNLSLADLLKGKQNAISALKQNATTQPEDNFNGNSRNKSLGVTKSMHVYEEKISRQENDDIEELEETEGEDLMNRRLPPPAASRLTIITNYDKPAYNDDQLAMKEYMNAQRKRLSSLRMDKENRAFSQVKQFDVVTEETTEKRIFVPSKHTTSSKKNENLEVKELPPLDSSPQTRYKPGISEDSTFKMFKTSPIPYSTVPTKITTQKSWRPSTTSDDSNIQNELMSKLEPTSTTARYINPDMIIKGNGLAEKRNHLALKPRLRLPAYYRPDSFEKKVITTPLPKTTTLTTTTRKMPTIITELPANAFTIDIKEIAGINNFIKKTKSESSESDGPLRISMKINSENLFTREEKRTTPNTFSTSRTPGVYNDIYNDITNNNDNNDLSTIFNIPNETNLNIKDELMEILKDNNRRVRLAKILSLRNMTFAELIALRERGSSQLHLADIFHNKSKEPTARGDDNLINTINTIENKTFFTKPSVVRNPDVETSSTSESTVNNYLKHNADLTDYTSLINTIPSNNVDLHSVRMPKKQNIYKLPTPDVNLAIQSSLIDVLNQQKTFNNMEQMPNVFQKHDEFDLKNTTLNPTTENSTKLQDVGEKLNTIEDNMADETHSYYSSINSKSENTYLQEDEEDYMQLSSGVRSAIFASSAIIAGSIIVFMSIFFIFKWQQKRAQLRYITRFNALSARRFPILQKSMIRKSSGSDTNSVIVNVTASSKNLLLNTEVTEEQNQQYLWNSLRKPYP